MKANINVVHHHGEDIDDTTVLASTEVELPDGTETGTLADELTTLLYQRVLCSLNPSFQKEHKKELAEVELRFWVEVEPVLPPVVNVNHFIKTAASKTVQHLMNQGDCSLEDAVSSYFGK